MTEITPVVLCGGSGTRLWPLSRKSLPKQFVPLVGDSSLLRLTLQRVAPLGERLLVVAADDHRFLVTETLQGLQGTGAIILEPVARNTAAAMALAALCASPDDLLLFCPADHHIPDAEAFRAMVRGGIPAARAGGIVTFGVVPNFPSTAYGYIRQGELRADGTRQVARFVEKPDREAAEHMLLEGGVLWNAGIFLATAAGLAGAIELHAPDILKACRAALTQAHREPADIPGYEFLRPQRAAFEECPAQSIDYAVMERHRDVAVIPFRHQWSDVGSWNAVADLTSADGDGNRVVGHGLAYRASRTYIHARHRPVVALGTCDLMIVDTPDAVLVCSRDSVEQVKDVVAELERANTLQAVAHRRVARPWGWYDTVDTGERFQVKRIGVKPGAALSLQKHYHRAEHWVVVRGTAEVTRGSETLLLSENESTYIPIGEVHRLRNPGRLELEMIEVQSGSYLGEDDIVRLEDSYGRVSGIK